MCETNAHAPRNAPGLAGAFAIASREVLQGDAKWIFRASRPCTGTTSAAMCLRNSDWQRLPQALCRKLVLNELEQRDTVRD